MRGNNLTGKYILDENGYPVEEPDLMKWSRWYENFKNRNIKQETVGNYFISTVFLGLDHSFDYCENNRPILFETMVFDERKKTEHGGSESVEQERYATKVEALKGHQEMVKKYS